MSSILKALKKIDEESPVSQAWPSLSKTIDTKRAVNSEARKRWLWWKVASAVLILVIVAAVGALLVSQKELILAKLFPAKLSALKSDATNASPEKSTLFRAKITANSTQTSSGSLQKNLPTNVPDKTVGPQRNIKQFQPHIPKTQPPTRTARRPPELPAISKLPPTNSAAQRETPVEEKTREQNTSTSEKSFSANNKAQARSGADPQQSTPVEYDRLDDAKLRLQALSWSQDASKRMAVINERIVREGESVDGYELTQIRQEDVVVSDGRKSWLLQFGLKQ